MKIILKYLSAFRWLIIAAIALLIGQAITDLRLPDLMADIVNNGLIGGQGQSYILVTGFKMIVIAFFGITANILVGLISSRVSAAVAKNMRHDVFEKVGQFSGAEFNKFSTASLITRTTNDIQQIQMLIMVGIRLVCYAPIMGIGGTIFAIQKSVSLSWIIAVAVIALLGVLIVIFAIALPKFKILQTLVDKINLVSRENLTGLLVIRAFGNEKHEEKRFGEANNDLYRTNLFVQRLTTLLIPAMTVIMNFVMLAIIWVGAQQISQSTIQIGDMMAFMQYAMQIVGAFLMVAIMFFLVPRAAVSGVRVAEVLNTELVIKDSAKPKKAGKVKGEITFNNVSFGYGNAEEEALSGISFTAKPGQTTAFIGSTGSGKSTLVNLIPRFYDVTSGSITLDGTDIREIDQEELRENIGYVPQKAFLFSGNVESNVSYGGESADDAIVRSAIEIAQAKDFVTKLEYGTKTFVAAGGDNLSGGQKQRLSIARALYKKPPIYIFDDSFSALDYKTDKALRAALKESTGHSTVLIVAARISTIMDAEQIIVLDKGRIAGKGTHGELLASCSEYRNIAESQLSKEELA